MGKTGRLSRFVTFILGVIELSFYGGLIYGWATLVFVLKEDGYYSGLCNNETAIETTEDNDDLLTCSEQDAVLNLVFTVASFSMQGSVLLTGLTFDNLGTRFLRLLLQ